MQIDLSWKIWVFRSINWNLIRCRLFDHFGFIMKYVNRKWKILWIFNFNGSTINKKNLYSNYYLKSCEVFLWTKASMCRFIKSYWNWSIIFKIEIQFIQKILLICISRLNTHVLCIIKRLFSRTPLAHRCRYRVQDILWKGTSLSDVETSNTVLYLWVNIIINSEFKKKMKFKMIKGANTNIFQ